MASISQQERVLIQVREMLLRGKFVAGMRLAEMTLAAQLGVSRTPVKLALTRLEEEGLVQALPSGGYAARSLTTQNLRDGIVLRAALEALAARLLAEQGMSWAVQRKFEDLLRRGDALLSAPVTADSEIDYDTYVAYGAMNDEFHILMLESCGNEAVMRAWTLNNRMPSASPSATLPLHESSAEALSFLQGMHRQHHTLVHAMSTRQGMRAYGVAHEHAEVAVVTLERYYSMQGYANASATLGREPLPNLTTGDAW